MTRPPREPAQVPPPPGKADPIPPELPQPGGPSPEDVPPAPSHPNGPPTPVARDYSFTAPVSEET
ncbi:MAG: hypothetical protein K2X72_34470 [Reyranella sp.]|nr:hypothetical protein [Reyranella sp.]